MRANISFDNTRFCNQFRSLNNNDMNIFKAKEITIWKIGTPCRRPTARIGTCILVKYPRYTYLSSSVPKGIVYKSWCRQKFLFSLTLWPKPLLVNWQCQRPMRGVIITKPLSWNLRWTILRWKYITRHLKSNIETVIWRRKFSKTCFWFLWHSWCSLHHTNQFQSCNLQLTRQDRV